LEAQILRSFAKALKVFFEIENYRGKIK
jgi:hypothetical protein